MQVVDSEKVSMDAEDKSNWVKWGVGKRLVKEADEAIIEFVYFFGDDGVQPQRWTTLYVQAHLNGRENTPDSSEYENWRITELYTAKRCMVGIAWELMFPLKYIYIKITLSYIYIYWILKYLSSLRLITSEN